MHECSDIDYFSTFYFLRKVAPMNLQSETAAIVNLVMNCKYCHPLSGCILSDLKGKKKQEIRHHLKGLSEKTFERIISYHESCPYRDRLVI
jgi:hypothetical protein